MSWSPTQYTKFEAERNRPPLDLLTHVTTTPVRRAIDLGCGPGNSTELLLERYPDADVSGIDSSPEMVAAARARLPSVRFDVADIATWSPPESFGVIFANASLQWLPDHARLFTHLTTRLSPGGSLAVQMPDNLDEPAHVLMREVAARGPWSAKLAHAGDARAPRYSPEWYVRALPGLTVDVWRTTYHHLLAGGPSAIVEWFKGSGLRPFLAPLDATERAHFLEAYTAAIADAYPTLDDGRALLPFPRLFIIAVR